MWFFFQILFTTTSIFVGRERLDEQKKIQPMKTCSILVTDVTLIMITKMALLYHLQMAVPEAAFEGYMNFCIACNTALESCQNTLAADGMLARVAAVLKEGGVQQLLRALEMDGHDEAFGNLDVVILRRAVYGLVVLK